MLFYAWYVGGVKAGTSSAHSQMANGIREIIRIERNEKGGARTGNGVDKPKVGTEGR